MFKTIQTDVAGILCMKNGCVDSLCIPPKRGNTLNAANNVRLRKWLSAFTNEQNIVLSTAIMILFRKGICTYYLPSGLLNFSTYHCTGAMIKYNVDIHTAWSVTTG